MPTTLSKQQIEALSNQIYSKSKTADLKGEKQKEAVHEAMKADAEVIKYLKIYATSLHNEAKINQKKLNEYLQNTDQLLKEKGIDFGRNLYKTRLAVGLENPRPNAAAAHSISDFYANTFWVYCGYENLADFEAENIQPAARNPEKPPMPSTFYVGYYYSFKSGNVRCFVVEANYSSGDARLWGFHRDSESKAAPKPYKHWLNGKMELDKYLFFQLRSSFEKHSDCRISMTISLGNMFEELENCAELPFLRGHLQTTSRVESNPISCEVILEKVEKSIAEKVFADGSFLEIERIKQLFDGKDHDNRENLLFYLMLQRRNFWTRPDAIDSLNNLPFRKRLVRDLKKYQGTWRLINFTLKRSFVIQCRLEIDEFFCARIFTPDKDYIAVINFGKGVQEKMMRLTTFNNGEFSMVTQGVFDLTNFVKNQTAEGMFMTYANWKLPLLENQSEEEREVDEGIIGGYAIIQKVKTGTVVEAKRMNQKDSKDELKKLREQLKSLWKRRIWEQKKGTGHE